jgi:hypothetical protein
MSHLRRYRSSRPSAQATRRPSIAAILGLAAAVLVCISSLLPWARADLGLLTVTKSGMDGDGAITLTIGIAAAALLLAVLVARLANPGRAVIFAIACLLGVACLVIAVTDIRDAADRIAELDAAQTISLQPAIYLTGFGGMFLAVAALFGFAGG